MFVLIHEHEIEYCHIVSYFYFFLPNLQLNIGQKYLKTTIIIDESLIIAIVLRNYSTKPNYIFQLKRELIVWIYIFNLFHFEVLIQNRNPKFRSLSLFVLTFHEYKAQALVSYKLSTSIHKERSVSVSRRLPQFTVEKTVLYPIK
jgi:hypothetical protein